ncbi:MAG: glycosyltransferase [Lachnoclostridium sp.]|nr:glycosyltransferase [Lachnoclostridium sp.]
MKITVVTVCYNAVKDIEQTMLSVLNQTYPNVEYIVIDGGSTDGTREIIEKYSSRFAYWCSEPDQGIYDAMNKGLAHATGEYINFMNAGDYFSSDDAIEKIVNALLPDDDIIYGDAIVIKPDKSEKFIAGETDLSLLAKRPIYRHNASFIRTALHRKFKFAVDRKKDFGYALDYDVIYRMWGSGAKIRHTDITVVTYLMEGTSNHKIKNVILNYRVSHQDHTPSMRERLRFCNDIAHAIAKSITNKLSGF